MQSSLGSCICGVELLRKLDALFRCELLELVVGFGVVVNHALAELLHVLRRSSFRRQFPEFNFRQTALCRLSNKRAIRGAHGGSALGATVAGLRARCW